MSNVIAISLIFLWISVLVLFLAVIILLKKVGKLEHFSRVEETSSKIILHRHDEGIPAGSIFPIKEVQTLSSELIDIQNTGREGVIVLFTSATCDICEMVYPGLEGFSS